MSWFDKDEEVDEVVLDTETSEDEVQEEETVPDKNFDQIVQEVREGKWGKGQERRLRLAQAGYDHVAIQKELVRIINGR